MLGSKRFESSEINPFVWFLIIGTGICRAIFFMAFPYLALHLKNDLSASASEIGFVLGTGPLVGTFTAFYVSYLADRWGRRPVLIVTLVIWGFTMVGFGFAHSIVQFGLLNVLNGICKSVSEPVIQASISDHTSGSAKVKAFHYRYYAVNIGAVFGPVAAGLFFADKPQLSFMLSGLSFFLFCLIYIYFKSAENIRTSKQEGISPSFLQALSLILKDRSLLCYVLAGILCSVSYVQLESTLPILMRDRFAEKGLTYYSWVLLTNGLTIVCCQLWLNHLTRNFKVEWSVAASCLVFALGFLGFGFSGNRLLFYILSMVVLSLGEVIVFSNGFLLIDRLSPKHLKATYHSTGNLLSLGFATGPLLGTWILEGQGQTTLFVFSALLLVVSALLYLLPTRLDPTSKERVFSGP